MRRTGCRKWAIFLAFMARPQPPALAPFGSPTEGIEMETWNEGPFRHSATCSRSLDSSPSSLCNTSAVVFCLSHFVPSVEGELEA